MTEKTMKNRLDPGLINVDRCIIISSKIGSIDVTQPMMEIMLYEDIMSPFITGKITLTDSVALGALLPLIGEELLYVEMTTPGFEGPEYTRKGLFSLYKMEARENIKLKNVGYTLCFISIEGVTDVNQKISTTFRGKISDIAEKLITGNPGLNTAKSAVVEKTSNNEIYTSNFWTPAQNLYYLTSKALNDINNPSYVFFENNEGFVFASLDALASIPPTYAFVKDSRMRSVEGKGEAAKTETQDADDEYTKVLDISVPSMYDYFERVQTGFYGGSVYNYDVETKRLNFKNLVAYDQLKKVKLNKTPLASDNLQFLPEANMMLSVIHRSLYNGSPVLAIDHHNRRSALLTQMSSMTINIRVYGKLNYSVGNVVEFTAYKDESTDKKDITDNDLDEILSGKYLVTAISHEVTRENHYCNIELCKDSVLKDFNKKPEA